MESTISGIIEVYKRECPGVVGATRSASLEGLVPMNPKDTPSEIPYGYCHCGCGQKTRISKKTCTAKNWVKGEPRRFIHGHAVRLKMRHIEAPNPSGLCQCGCGETTPLSTKNDVRWGTLKGYPVRFIKGHAKRTQVTPNDHIETFNGTVVIPLQNGMVTIVDAACYEQVRHYRWHAAKGTTTWYASTKTSDLQGKRDQILLHRLITEAPAGLEVDHRDGNGLNNTLANLRIATKHQNQRNTTKRADNTTGYKGVSRSSSPGYWRARIVVDGKRQNLGRFSDIHDAARAYDAAARKHFGEFAALNFPEEGERAA